MDAIKKLKQAISQCDYLLVGAGAGLSAAAGLSYADEAAFKRRYPVLALKGISSEYQTFSYRKWSMEQQWAYMAAHIDHVRNQTPPLPLYRALYQIIKEKNFYIITSNVDRQFIRNGFPADRLFEAQGSYDLLCCTAGCTTDTWESKPYLQSIIEHTNPSTFTAAPEALPRCPYCQAPMRIAFRDHAMYDSEKARYDSWLKQTASGFTCMVEFGVGFNSAGVIRVPFERIVGERSKEQVIFFRITADYPDSEDEIAYPEIPLPIADRAISINQDAKYVIKQLAFILNLYK